MISIGKVRDTEYYLSETHADDVHRYYSGNERSGAWVGSFAADLGLVDRVDPADFRAVLSGEHPDGGPLTATSVRVHAFDAAISLDKGSSLVRALGDPDTPPRFDEALSRARNDYVAFIEQYASTVRRGHAGADLQDGGGIAAAVFHHHSSREGDPQEHLHVVILNATRGPDGRVTALDTRQLYRTRYTAEAVFQASFRFHAAQLLGLTYGEPDRHGVAQVAGIPEPVRREFSQRRIQIEAAMANRGVTSAHAARIAALATRAPKGQPIPDEVMQANWRARALDHDFAVTDIPTHQRVPTYSVSDADIAQRATQSKSHFDRLEAIRQVAIASGDGAPLTSILERTDRYLASPDAVPLREGLWTTPEILELERRSVATATAGRVAPQANSAAVTAALQNRPTLGEDQAALVTTVAASGRTVDLVVGKAGAGKTFAIDALREAHEASGHRVLGAALAARAARELQHGAGIPSRTVHALIAAIDSGRFRLDHNTVLVVDEAAMVPTRQLAALVEEAGRAHAKLVLVGDPRQLPEIDAGGLFAALARRVAPVVLTENRRQIEGHERTALDHLRAGDSDRALDILRANGNVTVATNADRLRDSLVADWHTARSRGVDAAMVAAHRSDIADLNHRARQMLADAGTLGPVVLTSSGIDYRVGDEILTHHNRYDLGLINGQRGTVVGASTTGLIVDLEGRTAAEIPHEYIAEGHVTHGYALTIHKAQGMTADEAFILGADSLYAELGYTGLSRGRAANRLYVVASRDDRDRVAADPLADIRRSLGISRAQTAAIDLIEPPGGTP